MNRIIKFRCWLKGEMIQPCYVEIYEDASYAAGYKYRDSTEAKLMQCTGLKDKNGKEIYEGDIIKTHSHGKGMGHNYMKVEYDERAASFTIQTTSGKGEGFIIPLASPIYKEIEVVGNIYETPHLPNSEPEVQASMARDDDSKSEPR